MLKKFVLLFVAMVAAIAFAGSSCAEKLGVITGGAKGTYYQFGLDLQALSKAQGADLFVYNSNGSINNVYAVYKTPRTQMGIVQSDVLAFVHRVQSNRTLKNIAKKIKMVFPLYNEEVHLLGKGDLSDFDDLEGKRVAIGKEGSGTFLTAKLLFEVSQVRPERQVMIGTDEALAELKRGNIDAMFYVAGYPVKLFESVGEEDGLRVVPIQNKSIVEFYPKARIPEGTYAFQPGAVDTVAVKAVLVSFDFRRNNCEYVGKFAKMLSDNMGWLRENGHPKWRSVDLAYPLKGWGQYDCVRKYIGNMDARPVKQRAEINPVMEAVRGMF